MGRSQRRSLTGCRLFIARRLLFLFARCGLVLFNIVVRFDVSLGAKLWLALLLELELAVFTVIQV